MLLTTGKHARSYFKVKLKFAEKLKNIYLVFEISAQFGTIDFMLARQQTDGQS